ncbi:MAG TPA: hypothetical protein VJT31_41515, partial [Rugosimonospora sp.]|nr:hypothetical protein [Rugosimonospora sp.]
MVEPTTVVPVAFAGPGAGSDVLSWGQRELYAAMCRQHSWLPIGMAGPVPAGTSLGEVLGEVRFALSRYPTLRTRLCLDAPDGPRQVVSGSGELGVAVFDTPAGTDPGEFAERIRREYWVGPLDLCADWPVRVAVVRRYGVPAYLVVVLCHLATDGFGSIVLYQEMAGRD